LKTWEEQRLYMAIYTKYANNFVTTNRNLLLHSTPPSLTSATNSSEKDEIFTSNNSTNTPPSDY